jgi:hypothetical protein
MHYCTIRKSRNMLYSTAQPAILRMSFHFWRNMPTRPHCELLETRRLLSGGFTATGPALPITIIPGGRAAATATPVGSAGNSLIAYVRSNKLFARVIDPSAFTVVPEFQIDSQGLPVDPFSPMASTEDSSGNAVVVFPIGTGFDNLYIVRISPTGTVVDAASTINAFPGQTAPAVAAGPSGQVAVAYAIHNSHVNGGIPSVVARTFDSSDTPLSGVTLSDTPPQNVNSQSLTDVKVIYVPGASNYLAVWKTQNLDANSHNLGQSINDRSFTAAGVLGPDPVIASSPTDEFDAPQVCIDPSTQTCDIAFADQRFNSQGNFLGTDIEFCTTDSGGTPTFLTNPVLSTTSPTELIPDQLFLDTDNDVTVLADSGSQDLSGLDGTGVSAVTFNSQGQVLANNSAVFPFNQFYDPTVVLTGTDNFIGVVFAYDPNTNSTTISGTPGHFTPPLIVQPRPAAISVLLSATDVVRNADGAQAPDMVVTATLSAVASAEIDIHVDDLAPTTTFNGTHLDNLNENFSTTIVIPAGQLIGTAKVTIRPFRAGGPTSGQVTLYAGPGSSSNPSASSDFVIVDPTFSGNVTTVGGTTIVHGTATPGKPFVATDPDGTSEKISVTAGRADISTLPDGNLKVAVAGTTATSSLTISPTGKSDARFNIEQFIATSPLGTISAATTDINGMLKLKGATNVTLGNVSNQISLGVVKNAVLHFANLTNTVVTATGGIKLFSTTDWLGGSLSTTSITTLTDAGDFDADLTVATLGAMTISGAIGGASSTDIRKLRASQSVGAISAGSVANALIFAGVKPSTTALPAARTAFTNPKASIASFSLKGSAPSFSNTIIAAPIIGTISISGVVTTNPTPFGIAAESIKSYSRPPMSKKNATKKGIIDSQDQFSVTIL